MGHLFGGLGIGGIKNMIEYGIFGERSQIKTNQKQESIAFSLLIGRNLGLFPENTVLHCLMAESR